MIAAFDICFNGAAKVGTTSTNLPLAQSIIGVDQLLTMASRALYGSLVDPEIDVRRDPEIAAYSVDLGFRNNIGMSRRAQLAGIPEFIDPQEMAVGESLGWIAGKSLGLFQLMKALKGRKLTSVNIHELGVSVFAGDASFDVSMNTYKLLRHVAVRKSIERIVNIFDDPSVDSITFVDRTTGKVTVNVNRSEAAFFAFPVPEEVVLVDEVCTRALMLPTPNFRDDQVWTLFDGEQTVRTRMADKDFLRLIDHGVFRLNTEDIIVAKVHIKTVQTPTGLVSDWEIVKVLDHRKPGKHLPMPGV